jgi:hypothetical protein
MKKLFLIFFLMPTFIFAELISPSGLFGLADFNYYPPFGYDFNPKEVFEGAIICAKTRNLDFFFTHYHPNIPHRYVLITQDDQYSPGKYKKYLKDPKIIAWFGRNPSMPNKGKYFATPIGVNCLKLENRIKKLAIYEDARQASVTKEHLLYLNIGTKTKLRRNINLLFKDSPFCTSSSRKPLKEYLLDLKKSYFVLSPPGAGLDCYRTWEAIVMGSIPIVITSYLDPLFEDLPVLIVKDWNEINESFLMSKLKEISAKEINLEKLDLSYWEKIIRDQIEKERSASASLDTASFSTAQQDESSPLESEESNPTPLKAAPAHQESRSDF